MPGNSFGRARTVFESAIKHRPRIRLTLRQRTRVVERGHGSQLHLQPPGEYN